MTKWQKNFTPSVLKATFAPQTADKTEILSEKTAWQRC
jgi:hypothetical protein